MAKLKNTTMEKTAIEWLLDRIEDVDNTAEIWELIKIKAKEMEKQQIIDAYNEGIWERKQNEGEQYYNQTFNN